MLSYLSSFQVSKPWLSCHGLLMSFFTRREVFSYFSCFVGGNTIQIRKLPAKYSMSHSNLYHICVGEGIVEDVHGFLLLLISLLKSWKRGLPSRENSVSLSSPSWFLLLSFQSGEYGLLLPALLPLPGPANASQEGEGGGGGAEGISGKRDKRISNFLQLLLQEPASCCRNSRRGK